MLLPDSPFLQNPDWNSVKQQAQQQHKYILMDCYTDWCGWCKTMDRETFPDAAVASLMQSKFISVKYNMEKDFGIKLRAKYRVMGYPTYLIFDETGNLVYREVGYQAAADFLQTLNASIDPSKQMAFKGVSDQLDLNYPDFYVRIMNLKKDSLLYQEATAYLEKNPDLTNEVNWTVATLVVPKSEKWSNEIANNIDKYRALYGNEPDDIVSDMIMSDAMKATKQKDENALNAALQKIDQYHLANAEETKNELRFGFYEQTGDCQKMMSCIDMYTKMNATADLNILNDWTWSIFEKCDDADVIHRATETMKAAITNNSKADYASMDTYANLLFKDHQNDAALAAAQKAIEMGTASGDDVKGTQQLLDKIKAAKAGSR